MILRWWRQRRACVTCMNRLALLESAARRLGDARHALYEARKETDAVRELAAHTAHERDAALAEVRRLRAELALSRWPRVN